jgi:hypothetical protein
MIRQLILRMAGAAGLLALALVFVGMDPFLSAGAVLTKTPAVSVNRTLKGDRLPLTSPAIVTLPNWQAEFGNLRNAQPQKPFACDPAFSPIFASKAANFYGRCLA